MFKRAYQELENYFEPNRVLIIYGPRRAGKTTLLQNFLKKTNLKYKLESGENYRVQEVLGSNDFDLLKKYVEGYQLLAIDEAQYIKVVGQGLKILNDQVPDLKIIATGSSSFELSGQIGEPLTGRKKTLTLLPLSQQELSQTYNSFELKELLPQLLVFGSYPEVLNISSESKKIEILQELTDSYLIKDILALEKVKNSKVIFDLLRLIAFQIGNEVSLSELGSQLGLDKKTVARYLDLLEKNFVLFNLRGFSKNLRSEVTRKSKYFFYDLGIRNSIIANFNPIEKRNDIGSLWENFCIIERLKKLNYENIPVNSYFWRTWEQKEVDLVEESNGELNGFEFKWNPSKQSTNFKTWLESYPEATLKTITPENYLDFTSN
jgi:uncharacterized protein